MSTAREMIRERLDAGCELSNESVAIDVMNELGVPASASIALVDIVAGEVGRIRRDEVRGVEHAAERDQKVPSRRRTLGMEPQPIDARQRLLDETFATGDGRHVRWGDATVDDHAARIAMLSKLCGGITQTIARHEEAISTIRRAGATCLREIEEAA